MHNRTLKTMAVAVSVLAAVVVVFVVMPKYLQNLTTARTNATCEYLGTGTVEEIFKSRPDLRNAGFEVAVVKIKADSTRKTGLGQLEWRVMVPVAMAFTREDEVELCGYFYQPHPQATHFIPIVTRLTSPAK